MDASDLSGSGAPVTLLGEWGWREEGKPASMGGVSEQAIAGGSWGLALPGTQGIVLSCPQSGPTQRVRELGYLSITRFQSWAAGCCHC